MHTSNLTAAHNSDWRSTLISGFKVAFLALMTGLLGACSLNPGITWDQRMQTRQAELAHAISMPGDDEVRTIDWQWDDPRPPRYSAETPRTVMVRLHWPASTPPGHALPLVVFSHGLGGSREGYSYLGRYWAAHGIASLHIQHPGSDRSVWRGPALELVSRLQTAAQPDEALDRVLDVRFVIGRIFSSSSGIPANQVRIDPLRIAIAGHSYGANTALMLAGARVPHNNQTIDLRDSRLKAAIIISAPPFYGQDNIAAILQSARIPALHITSTADEITVPGYHSDPSDRIRIFDAYGGADKSLLVFKGGSHSMFTDRLNTGGTELNPLVKQATREATLAFLQEKLMLPVHAPSAGERLQAFSRIVETRK